MQGRIVANNGEAMRDMAIAGLGVTLVPLFIAHDALADGRLVRLVEHLTPVPLPISAVWPPVKPMPMKLRAIVNHFAKAFSERPAWIV
jgi:DNA-binding transcriptional LysR family regulator